jgi:hypothetical protein
MCCVGGDGSGCCTTPKVPTRLSLPDRKFKELVMYSQMLSQC